jgi:hypothetical protein
MMYVTSPIAITARYSRVGTTMSQFMAVIYPA